MAHSAPPSGPRRRLASPHRRLESVLGVLLLLVGIAVAVVAVTALDHPKGHLAAKASQEVTSSAPATVTASGSPGKSSSSPVTNPPAGTPTTNHSTPSSSPAGSGRLPLIVLNNTSDISASTAAERFEQGGWTVTDTSTFDGAILSTAAYYDPDVAGAQAAAEALQSEFPAIKRVKEKFDGLPEGPIVVVLTSDYS